MKTKLGLIKEIRYNQTLRNPDQPTMIAYTYLFEDKSMPELFRDEIKKNSNYHTDVKIKENIVDLIKEMEALFIDKNIQEIVSILDNTRGERICIRLQQEDFYHCVDADGSYPDNSIYSESILPITGAYGSIHRKIPKLYEYDILIILDNILLIEPLLDEEDKDFLDDLYGSCSPG